AGWWSTSRQLTGTAWTPVSIVQLIACPDAATIREDRDCRVSTVQGVSPTYRLPSSARWDWAMTETRVPPSPSSYSAGRSVVRPGRRVRGAGGGSVTRPETTVPERSAPAAGASICTADRVTVASWSQVGVAPSELQ